MTAKSRTTTYAARATVTKAKRVDAARDTIPAWLAPIVFALVTALLFPEFIFGNGNLLGTTVPGEQERTGR